VAAVGAIISSTVGGASETVGVAIDEEIADMEYVEEVEYEQMVKVDDLI